MQRLLLSGRPEVSRCMPAWPRPEKYFEAVYPALGTSVACALHAAADRQTVCSSPARRDTPTTAGYWGKWTSRSIWTDAPHSPEFPRVDFYDSTIPLQALEPIETLSLGQMLDFARQAMHDPSKLLTSARHVHRELPKRLARRLMDLQFLPYIVVTNPHIKRVYESYYHAFATLRAFSPPQTVDDNARFSALLIRLVNEHAPIIDALAHGLRECSSKPFVGARLHLDKFLASMLRSRISRRVLAEQHINLDNRRLGYIGLICTNLSLQDCAEFAASKCKQICTETYGRAADVIISGDLHSEIAYIPEHLDYILFELVKNAMRAVVESHNSTSALPPIQIKICESVHDITLRVSDQGGGIAVEELASVFRYGYTTMDVSRFRPGTAGAGEVGGFGSNLQQQMDQSSSRYRMGGLGFGLPLSRLYAQYFGGDLQLVSMPGYGIDAFLTIKRLENTSWEEQHADDTVVVEQMAFA